jgi:hypothetical protein
MYIITMTLIITLIRPEGIWQSADNRITRNNKVEDDSTPKQLHIICPPLPGGSQVLMGFTGIAEMPDGTPTLQWIEETLRGETRTIMETLNHLCKRLTRDLGKSQLWKNRLIITGGIFEKEKKFYFEIRNVTPKTFEINKVFDFVVMEVTSPQVFVGGSGSTHIKQADWQLLKQQSGKKPAKWEDHLGLLAAVNRRAAQIDKLVSPWCQASYLSNGSEGVSSKRFSKKGEPGGPPGIHTIVAGIDLLPVSLQVLNTFEKMKKGDLNTDDENYDDMDVSVKGRP